MKIRKFENIGETLYEKTLQNGMRLFAVPKKGFRSSFAMIAVRYGGAYRRFTLGGEAMETPAGVAHYLEHKLFDMPDGVDAIAALSGNGANPNAYTSNDTTVYHFDCTDGFEDDLRILASFVSTPYFTPQTVEKEKGIIAQEIGMYDDRPEAVVFYELMRMLYSKHPVRDKIAGTVESISKIDDKMLYDCYGMFYRPNNMIFCAAGDFDPERVFAVVEECLAQLPSFELPETELYEPDEAPSSLYSERRMELSAPQFSMGCRFTPEKGKALQRQKLISSLALRILLGVSGDFYNELYNEGKLNRDYDFEAEYSAGTATVLIGGESSDPEYVRRKLLEAVERVRVQGLDDEVFERARRASYGARLRGLEDFDSLCAALASSSFNGYCSLDAFELLGDIRKEECEQFICDTLCEGRLALSVLRPLEVRS